MKKVIVDDIINIINSLENIKITNEQMDDDLSLLGMDSITFIQMIVALEEFYDCEIPDSKLLFSEFDTIRKIYNVISDLSI